MLSNVCSHLESQRSYEQIKPQGTEFTNNPFKKFLEDNNIELYHVYNEGKAAVIERFNRTLGEMIQKHLTSRQDVILTSSGLACGGTGLCSYRVRGVDDSCAEHLTVESYTIIICQQSYLLF